MTRAPAKSLRSKAWLLLLIATVAASLPAGATEPLVLQGATTFNSRLIEPYKSEIEARFGAPLTIMANRSVHGLVALLEQRASLAMLSAPLDSELAYLRRQYPAAHLDALTSFEIARTSIAFIVHPDNPVKRLTLDDIRRILRGVTTNWLELGGADHPIKPVFVREGGGVIVTVQTQLLDGAPIKADAALRFDRPRQVPKVVAQEPGALGIAQLQIAREAGFQPIETDGVVAQTLNLVALGKPTARQMKLIETLRAVAVERLY